MRAFVLRLGGFFVLLLLVGALAEGVFQQFHAKRQTEEVYALVSQTAADLAQKAGEAGGVSGDISGLPEAMDAWVLLYEEPKPGQIAALRRKKVIASTPGASGPLPPEVSKAADQAKSRALEGKTEPHVTELDAALYVAAPLLRGGECIGAAVLKTPFSGLESLRLWPLALLVISLGAVLTAIATAGQFSLRRAISGAVLIILNGVALAWVYASQQESFRVALVGVVLAAGVAFVSGFGLLEKWRKEIARARYAYYYIAPAMLGMLILVFLPFAVGMGLSFFKHDFGEWRFVGLENFIRIVSGGRSIASTDSFYFKLLVTILWTTSNVFFHVSIGLGLALLLNQPGLKGKTIYRLILILPWAIPSYITALIWRGMFHPSGMVNAILGTTGLSWKDSFWKAFFANLSTNVWLGVPFMMVVCLGALQSIPKDVYEAAAIDGASAWQRFWKITVPLLRPALLPAIVLGMIWTFNMFNVIYLVSEGEPGGATEILITEAYKAAFERQAHGGEYGYAAAYSTVIFAILILYTLGTARVTGLTKGADD